MNESELPLPTQSKLYFCGSCLKDRARKSNKAQNNSEVALDPLKEIKSEQEQDELSFIPI